MKFDLYMDMNQKENTNEHFFETVFPEITIS